MKIMRILIKRGLWRRFSSHHEATPVFLSLINSILIDEEEEEEEEESGETYEND